MFRNLFAIPNETHSLSAPISLKNDINSTMMSVSFAIISMRLYRAIQHSLHATSLWCRTLHGCMALADIQTHQLLAQDSPIHLHPELTLLPFLHRRRSQQWLLTDNGTVPPCYFRSADSGSNFSEISHSHHVASAV